ncbi:GlxA family transcriptional regulator [Dichotomicrobium thermohalophilum]|uniref:AraC family transcriptional regulator with amidase-like domain n=1 Tax=Dichotomicrobium thermohalophilum TaxID=933063 RepID=A0A397PDU6_9HYPH|nr:helix-turn-helix domain-containing protein [Dichotomicrobium thermohalophilum]RIA47676.1 AraC family transcriptional regulator with amidase-like domain [Dichotomicrobium thermohalophilum]
MTIIQRPIHVSLAGLSGALSTPITGLYESLHAFPLLRGLFDDIPSESPFDVDIVAARKTKTMTASGLPLSIHRTIDELNETDIVIVPSMLCPEGYEWRTGDHPELVAWMRDMHANGALLCSACSGALVLAETGLLDGRCATIHWAFAPTFERNFPSIKLCVEEVLVTAGDRSELVMSGASASWTDLLLYLVARFTKPSTARALAKFMLMQWHTEGQAPFLPFCPPSRHGDSMVLSSQQWLLGNYSVGRPVEAMTRMAGVSGRTLERRFKQATGYKPIEYVARIRVEEGKRRLEQSDAPIEQISWEVGYEDAAAFRRLFKRITRLTPSEYRKRFQAPKLH